MSGLQGIFAFAEAARQGSFAAAARELGLSPSAVAKAVARLESDLGVRLFHRTTRQVTLTGEGQEMYERCRRVVEEVDALRADAEGIRGQPSGTLRINVPITYGKRIVVPALARLARRHPKLAFDVALSDRWVDLVQSVAREA
jgi:DNA-binding transcriptional LysR family regulator